MTKVLVVEDDEILLDMYQKLLANHGYDVKTAVDGEAGLKTARQEHPNLILLDMIMPKMDGMTMLKQLRQDSWGANVPVILLTNLDPSDTILQGIAQNRPAYYVIKSDVEPEQILEKIQSVLETHRQE